MAITYTIPGVPLLNQLAEKTTDGQVDENARMNCVFTSNAALATAYLGKPFYGDQLKDMDASYGQGYTGGASEKNLADTMARLGITMTRTPSSTQQGLVDIIHREVPQGHGVIITMPSQWNSVVWNAGASWNPRTYSGPSHVGLACGVGPGMIRVMNPWGGFWHDGTDGYWSARLLDGEVWVGVMTGATAMATVTIPTGWKDDGKTLVAPNGVPVVLGFRTWVLTHPWDASNVPMKPEAPADQIEPGNAKMGGGSRQDFRFSSLGCQQHADGSWGSPYVIAVGQDIVALETQLSAANAHVAQLAAQVADLQKQLAAVPAPAPAPQPDPLAMQALDVVTRMKALFGEL